MGQKVNPISFRLGYCRGWDSLWYANRKNFADQLLEDVKIRKFIKGSLKQCAVSQVVIERASEKIRINIHTARPGVIIGRKGADIDRLREDLTRLTNKTELQINIREVKNPATSAQLVSENIALQLERRIAFRRAMKKSMQQTMDAGGKGIQVKVKGRLGGSEIARTEWYRSGSIPLHTIRADVDYGFAESMTTYGKIGVKVWIYRGEVIERPNLFNAYAKDAKEERGKPSARRPAQSVAGQAPDKKRSPVEQNIPGGTAATKEDERKNPEQDAGQEKKEG